MPIVIFLKIIVIIIMIIIIMIIIIIRLRSALLCLRGTRRKRRAVNISDIDITSESAQARI